MVASSPSVRGTHATSGAGWYQGIETPSPRGLQAWDPDYRVAGVDCCAGDGVGVGAGLAKTIGAVAIIPFPS